jgi:alpha-1,3-rhamnosyl/mannosyltransferase
LRIALDARTLQDHFPGIGRYTFNLVLALADVAPTDELFLLYDPLQRNTRFDLDLLRAKHNVRLIHVGAGPFALSAQWRVPAALNAVQANVYHSAYYLMPYLARRPTVVTLYDMIPLRYSRYFSPAQRLVFRAAMRLSILASERLLAISKATAGDLHTCLHVRPERIVVTPLAPDPALQRVSASAIAELRARYTLPERFVLYVGSNKPHKNLVRLVEAQARLPSSLRVPLVIAGHWDPRHPEAKQVAARLDLSDVRWLGAIPGSDLAALYSAALLFVFPSEYEGFGLPVLEAMACGTPVICSRASSLPEVAADAALLFDPYDVSDIADVLRQALADEALRAQLTERGAQRVLQFSWSKVAAQTHAVYRQVCYNAR